MVWRTRTNKVDESLDVFACHGIGGIWGALATSILATVIVNSSGADGAIYGNGIQILKQLTSVAAIGGYSFGVSWGLAMVLKAAMGLRVSATEETVGLDLSQHGESAYGGVLR